MSELLIAPCGMNCAVCSAYLSFKNELRRKGIMGIYCPGCRPRGKNCAFMKKNCYLLANGLVQFCYECAEFPCRRLKSLDKRYRSNYHMSEIENLIYIKEYGMAEFLKKEKKKWKCPDCGGVISCHNGICYTCGLEKLKNKKRKYCWTDD